MLTTMKCRGVKKRNYELETSVNPLLSMLVAKAGENYKVKMVKL